MPTITLHKDGEVYQDQVGENTNLVVSRYSSALPSFALWMRYGSMCQMCLQSLAGDDLPPANWKEKQLTKSARAVIDSCAAMDQ